MHGEAAYAVFFGFGIIWIAMGVAAMIAILKLDNQPLRFGKWGLVVAIPILVPLIAAFAIAAFLA